MASIHDAHAVPAGHWARTDDMGRLLDRVAGEIQERIVEVERRHAIAMRDMQAKLERLSGDAVRARPAMPPELATAFGRIEAGMADLVDRISETVPERRRGAEAFVFGEPAGAHNHFVFNPPPRAPVAPIVHDGAGQGEQWDTESADALARLYESGEAALGQHLPEAALFAGERAASVTAAVAPRHSDLDAAAGETRPAELASGVDSRWIDQQFAALSEHVSKTVRGAQPVAALEALMSRVDRFETRFNTALDDLAVKAHNTAVGQDALAHVEAQIRDLASHIDAAHQQLARLDVIEQHLGDLTAFAHASMEASAEPSDGHAAAVTAPDLAQLADLAVERALTRLPAATAGVDEAATAGVAELQTLLKDFAAEQRQGDRQTAEVLETLQEAMVRLIDRLDAIDAGAAQPQPQAMVPPVEPAAPIAAETEALAADVAALEEAATARDAKSLKTVRRRERRIPEAIAAAAAAVVAEPVSAEPATATKPAGRVPRQAIHINDLKLDIGRPEAAAAEVPSAAAARTARIMQAKATPASGGLGRRGMAVAALALALVGASYMASLMFGTPFGSRGPGRVADGPPPAATGAMPAATTPLANTAAAPAAPVPGRAMPAAMVPAGTPPTARSETLPPIPAKATGLPSVSVVPAGAPASGALPVPSAAKPAPGGSNLEFTPTKPRSIPETVTDDLSEADVDDPDRMATDVPSTRTLAQAEPDGAPLQAMPGMALSMTSAMMPVGELATTQRRVTMAAASERAGLQARTAASFSQRYGTATAAEPVAEAKPMQRSLSPIVTGSNPPARMQAPTQQLDDPVVAGPASAMMPPALAGPLSLRIAASKGDPSAAFEVATRLAEGRGIRQDFKEALVWYQRAAAKGLAIAQYRLGTHYERGLGTGKDLGKAAALYRSAAEQGNVKAMHNLAVLSASNAGGTPDYAAAAKWFLSASGFGLTDSQFNLAVLYENGLGVAKDLNTAYVWYALAARNGDAEATRRRDKLLGVLDVASLQTADDRIRQWHAHTEDSKINDARVAGDLWRTRAAQLQ